MLLKFINEIFNLLKPTNYELCINCFDQRNNYACHPTQNINLQNNEAKEEIVCHVQVGVTI